MKQLKTGYPINSRSWAYIRLKLSVSGGWLCLRVLQLIFVGRVGKTFKGIIFGCLRYEMKSKSSKLTQTVSHVWVQLESFKAATRDLPPWVVTLMLASAIFYRTRIVFCGEIKAQDRKKLKQDATPTTNIYLHGNFEKLIQKNISRDDQKGSQIQPKHTMNHDFSNAQFLSTRNKVDNVE